MARWQATMTIGRGLVLDANILIRAVLGKRVRSLLETYEESMPFYTPDICLEDAREYIPDLLVRRGGDPQAGLIVLHQIGLLVQAVDHALYRDFFGSGLATWTTDRVELYLGGTHA
jgi:hypothetical protein